MAASFSAVASQIYSIMQHIGGSQLSLSIRELTRKYSPELPFNQLNVPALTAFFLMCAAVVFTYIRGRVRLFESLKHLGARAGLSSISMSKQDLAVADYCNHSFFFALAPDAKLVAGDIEEGRKEASESLHLNPLEEELEHLAQSYSHVSIVELTFGTDLPDVYGGSKNRQTLTQAVDHDLCEQTQRPFPMLSLSPTTTSPSTPPSSSSQSENVGTVNFSPSSCEDVFLDAENTVEALQGRAFPVTQNDMFRTNILDPPTANGMVTDAAYCFDPHSNDPGTLASKLASIRFPQSTARAANNFTVTVDVACQENLVPYSNFSARETGSILSSDPNRDKNHLDDGLFKHH